MNVNSNHIIFEQKNCARLDEVKSGRIWVEVEELR